MSERVVFHIGDHKTGSTSIQQVLAAGAWEGPALAFPVSASRLNHKPASYTLYKPNRLAHRATAFGKLNRRLKRAEPEIGVISAESFESAQPADLAAAIAAHMPDYAETAQVIAYVRPHAERILSSYTQVLKIGNFTGTLERFAARAAEKRSYHYAPRFNAWRKVFGARFILRPMVRGALFRGDVVADFLKSVLGTEAFQVDPAFSTGNESLSLADMVMIRGYHRAAKQGIRNVDNRGKACWHMARLLAADPTERTEKLAIDAPLMAQIEAEYRADAEALDQAFFDGPVMAGALDRAHEKAVPAVQPLALEDHFDPQALRLIDVMGEMTDTLLARDPKSWNGYFRKVWMEELRDDD